LVFYDKKGKIVKVYPCGSEEHQRFKRVLEILFEADIKCLEKLIQRQTQKEWEIDNKIIETDKKIFRKCIKRSEK